MEAFLKQAERAAAGEGESDREDKGGDKDMDGKGEMMRGWRSHAVCRACFGNDGRNTRMCLHARNCIISVFMLQHDECMGCLMLSAEALRCIARRRDA
jgi:hypothetical protein